MMPKDPKPDNWRGPHETGRALTEPHEPCPFCGSDRAEMTTNTAIEGRPVYTVRCLMCAAEGPWQKGGESSALGSWNRRASRSRRTRRPS